MRRFITSESLSIFASDPSKKAYSDQSDIHWLSRIQSASFDISLNREVMKDIGSEDFFIQRYNIENYTPPASPGEPSVITAPNSSTDENLEPLVSLDFSYYLTDGKNEKCMGLAVNKIGCNQETAFCSNLFKDQNIFLSVHKDNGSDLNIINDAVSFNEFDIIGFGNCYITNYSLSVSVGTLPLVSTRWVASNVETRQYNGNSVEENKIPAINSDELSGLGTLNPGNYSYALPISDEHHEPELAAIKPSDILVEIPALDFGGINTDDSQRSLPIESFNFDVEIARDDLYGMGSIYAFDRKLNFPLRGNINLSFNADTFKKGSLTEVFKKDQPYDLFITVKNSCHYNFGDNTPDRLKFRITNAIFLSENHNVAIGQNSKIDLSFYFSVTSGHGLFVSAEENSQTQLTLSDEEAAGANLDSQGNISFHGIGSSAATASDELIVTIRNTSTTPPTDEDINVPNIFAAGKYESFMASALVTTYTLQNSDGIIVFTFSAHPSSNNTVVTTPAETFENFELVSVAAANQPGSPSTGSYSYQINSGFPPIQSWINGNNKLKFNHKGNVEYFNVEDLNQISNNSTDQVGTVKYYLLDDPINFSGGCLEYSEIQNLLTNENEINVTSHDFDLTDNFCPPKQIIVLFEYNHNGIIAHNFKVINFLNELPPTLSSLTFKDVSIFGENSGPFNLDHFIENITVIDEIGGEVDATFVLEEDNVPRHTMLVENVASPDSDLSIFNLPPLYVGKYKLYLKSLTDCSGQVQSSFNEGINAEIHFEVVKFNIEYPNLPPLLNSQQVAYLVPTAKITYTDSLSNKITYLESIEADSVVRDPGTISQSSVNTTDGKYYLSRGLDDYITAKDYEISWNISEENKFSFSNSHLLSVEDLSPPVLKNVTYNTDVIPHYNAQDKSLRDFIIDINISDNCTPENLVKIYVIHSWGLNYRYKEFILIDPNHNATDNGNFTDDPEGSFVKYKTYNSIDNALLNQGQYYDCIDEEDFQVKSFGSTKLNSGIHKIEIKHLQDLAGNYSIIKDYGFIRILDLQPIFTLSDQILEAGSGETHIIPKDYKVGLYGGGSTLFDSFSLNIESITPNTRPELKDISSYITVTSELLDPETNEEFTVKYNTGPVSNFIEPGKEYKYKISIRDTKAPELKSISSNLTSNLSVGDSISLSDFNIDVDAFDLGSKYDLEFTFRLTKPDGTSVSSVVSNTTSNNSGIVLDDAVLENGAIAGTYILNLVSIRDLQQNTNQINSEISRFLVKRTLGLSINQKENDQIVAWAPKYQQSEIIFCYDGSGSMGPEDENAVPKFSFQNHVWPDQKKWIHETIKKLKALEDEGTADRKTFKIGLVQFSDTTNLDKELSFLDQEISVGGMLGGGTEFDLGLNLSGKQFSQDTNKYKIILFTSDGANPTYSQTDGISNVTKKLYEINKDSNTTEEKVRIRTVPVQIANASVDPLKAVGRGGQGLGPDKEPEMLEWNDTSQGVPTDLFFQTLQIVSPQNGFITFSIVNTSTAHLYIDDLDDQFVTFDLPSEIKDIKSFGSIMRESSERFSYIPPRGTQEFYYNIVPSRDTIQDIENDQILNFNATFNLNYFVYFDRPQNLGSLENLIADQRDSLFNIQILTTTYANTDLFSLPVQVNIQAD